MDSRIRWMGAAAVLLLAAPRGVEARENCFSIAHKPATTECQAPFECACEGGSIQLTRVQVSGVGVGVTAKGTGSTDNCCRTLIAIPEHDELVGGPFEVQNLTIVPGKIYTGGCEKDCTSVLFGLAAWGTAVCAYDNGSDFGAYPLYMNVGSCLPEEDE